MKKINYVYHLSQDSYSSERLEQLRGLLKELFDSVSKDIVTRIDSQTQLLKDIKAVHPAEKKAHTKIGQFLKKITKIEVMAVIIAILQLIIAIPQLKIAYDSFENDETRNFKVAFNEFVTHTENLAIIDIPDTLISPEIKDIRKIQRELFFNLQLLAHSNLFFSTESNEPRDISLSIYNMTNRLIEIEHCCQRINLIEQKIIETYYPEEASCNNTNKCILSMYIPTEQLIAIGQVQTNINDELSRFVVNMKQFTEKRHLKIREFREFKSYFEHNMPLENFTQYIRLQDELGLAFINALNQIQYSMCYGITTSLN